MAELSAGQIIADKYRMDSVVGSGGMGVVVAATHVDLDQKVAIKLLRDASSEALARFRREARLLVRLKSPHVARVFDVGSLEDDTPYIVMELLEGSDLSSVLKSRGRLPIVEAVDYVLQACEAVAEAHALGMVHRDLKPANLFLAQGAGGTPIVKVLDFGVSKILDDRPASELTRGGDLTNEGVALGSPGYMSPEQMTSSRDVDARSDVFSLGAILYRLVSGQTPWKGNSVISVLAAMAVEPLAPLDSVAPDAPPTFARVVETCLAQDREARFPTVAHLAIALMPFASRRGKLSVEQIATTLGVPLPDGLATTAERPAIMPSPAAAFPPVPASPETVVMPISRSVTAAPSPSGSSKGGVVVLALGLFLLAAAAVWIVVRRATPPPVAAPAESVSPAPTASPPAPSSTTTAVSGTVLGASPMPEPPPEVEPTAPAAPATTSRPAARHPPRRPPAPRTSATSSAPPPPPSPTEVPASRH